MKAMITIGIPGCGKSTWASAQSNYTEINLDNCREQVCGDASNQLSTPDALILQMELINQAALKKENIIISDCNIKEVHRFSLENKLKELGYEIEEVLFITNLQECKQRNSNRSRIVPEEVLDAMQSTLDSTFISPSRFFINNKEIPTETIFNLIIYKIDGNISQDLIEHDLIINNVLTNQGYDLLQFCIKNYRLDLFHPEIFIEGLRLLENGKINYQGYSEISGIKSSLLENYDYQNIDLWNIHDNYATSLKLYNLILTNLKSFLY